MADRLDEPDRTSTEKAVLEALVNRGREGMTVLELRAAVEAEIDELEGALGQLKEDRLITVDYPDGSAVITPAERVVPDDDGDEERTFTEWLRDRLPL